MKITKPQLLDADLNTLFTRDPATFFEAILINILWDKEPSSIDHELVERQKLVFLKWHKYFGDSLHADIEKEYSSKEQAKLATSYEFGKRAGKIHALQNLPFKKGALGRTVDINAVTELLRKLKAQEPIGVTTNEQAKAD